MRYFLEDNKRAFVLILVGLFVLALGAGFKSMYYGAYLDKAATYKAEVAKLQDERDLLNEEIAKTNEKVAKDDMAITADQLKSHEEIVKKFFSEYYAWDSKDKYETAMKAGKDKFGDDKKAFAKKFKVDADKIESAKQKSEISTVTLYPRKVEGGTVLYYATLNVERTTLEGEPESIETLLSFSVNADGDVARVKMMY